MDALAAAALEETAGVVEFSGTRQANVRQQLCQALILPTSMRSEKKRGVSVPVNGRVRACLRQRA
jgi:hypothetical protein